MGSAGSGADVLVGDCARNQAPHPFRDRRDRSGLPAAPVLQLLRESAIENDTNTFAVVGRYGLHVILSINAGTARVCARSLAQSLGGMFSVCPAQGSPGSRLPGLRRPLS